MSKIIITHLSPDLDAVTSSWLIKKYMPDWQHAEHKFVPTGTTLNGQLPDEDSDIIHVDTGLGRFDHHQFEKNRELSATRLVFEHLSKNKNVGVHDLEAVSRISDFVTLIDNFGEVHFHDPSSDIYDFCLYQVIEGLKPTGKTDIEVIEIGFSLLDGVLHILKNKIIAEREIKKGLTFDSKWGKTMALETKNDQVLKLALKTGFACAVKKNPEVGFVRINTLPDDKLDLTDLYKGLKNEDPKASWFLHSSKNLLINGSAKDPTAVASTLTLTRVIEIMKKIT